MRCSASEDGYVHDAQCLIYHGPDEEFEGREICYGYNEDSLTIYDVTDKKAPVILSNTSYEGAAYTHQGVVLDPKNQQYLLLDDEYDEYEKVGPGIPGHPITYIWDISSLKAPKQTGLYKSGATGIDHNQYVADGFAYQSNYGTGLRILDVRSIPQDPTGAGVKEIAFFDIYPEDDNLPGGGSVDFVGTWSSYGLFKSGFITINTMERGVFVVKLKEGARSK
jgi:choice-of-anchor B domain-containing protein